MNITKLTEIYEKNFLLKENALAETFPRRGTRVPDTHDGGPMWDMNNPDAEIDKMNNPESLPEVNLTELLSKIKAVRDKDLLVVTPDGVGSRSLEDMVRKKMMVSMRVRFINQRDLSQMDPAAKSRCDIVMYKHDHDAQAKERAARVASFDKIRAPGA